MKVRKLDRSPSFAQRLAAIHTDLVQFEQLVDGLWVTLSGLIQQAPALI